MLKTDTHTTTMPNITSHVGAEEFTKKKQKSMMQLLMKYTGGASKKTRKDSDKVRLVK
jgi:hypothetical protein